MQSRGYYVKDVAIKIYSGKNLLHNAQNYVNGVKTFLKLKRKLNTNV